jgi:hypothetical protein
MSKKISKYAVQEQQNSPKTIKQLDARIDELIANEKAKIKKYYEINDDSSESVDSIVSTNESRDGWSDTGNEEELEKERLYKLNIKREKNIAIILAKRKLKKKREKEFKGGKRRKSRVKKRKTRRKRKKKTRKKKTRRNRKFYGKNY